MASDSRASLGGAGAGGLVPARGPAGAAVMGAAAWVTSRGGDTRKVGPGAAVRDAGRDGRRGAAAVPGGDIGGRDQVAVAGELAARAGQDPPGRLGDPGPAGRAGGGGAALVHQLQADPGGFGLVGQHGDQVADAPVAGALVMPPSGLDAEDAAGVADGQGADPAGHRPGDDGFGGFVLGLADPPPVPRLGQPLPAPVVPPPSRPPLPWFGCAAGGRPGAALAVGQVHPVLGADRPPRHQQRLAVWPGHRIRVDDPQIHPRHPARIRLRPRRIGRHRDLGGYIDPQPPRLVQQRDRADLFFGVGRVPVQPHPQQWPATGDRDPQPPPGEHEGAVIPAQRHQRPPPPREPRPLITAAAALGGSEPGIGVAAQHRPRARAV